MQVLSETVSNALLKEGGEEAKETAIFVNIFDKFFDCLNVRNLTDGKTKRKMFQDPYRSGTDFRLKWLEETFLPYLEEWEAEVDAINGLTSKQKEQMLLSKETLGGLKMTTTSFIELVKYLFTVPGVRFFLSRRLFQDPLEKFFGCQRQIGRTHDNTTVNDFERNTQALRVVDSFCRASVKSNCRGNEELNSTDHEMYSLPKRKKKSKDNDQIRSTDDESLATPPTTMSVTNFDLSDITITATEPCDIILEGVKEIKAHSIVISNSTLTKATKAFLTWVKSSPYPSDFIQFSESLTSTLYDSCFSKKKSVQAERYICIQFHALRTSSTFHSMWKAFLLTTISFNPGPTFYQHLTHKLLHNLVYQKYKLQGPDLKTH